MLERDPWVDAAIKGGIEALHWENANSGLPRDDTLDDFLREQGELTQDPDPTKAADSIFFDPKLHERAASVRKSYLNESVALFRLNRAQLRRMAGAPRIYKEAAGYAEDALIVLDGGWVIEDPTAPNGITQQPDVEALSPTDLRSCTQMAANIRSSLEQQAKLITIEAPKTAASTPKSRKTATKPAAVSEETVIAPGTAGYEASLIGATLLSLGQYAQLSNADADESPKYREGAYYLLQDVRAALNGWLGIHTPDSLLSGGIEAGCLGEYLDAVKDASEQGDRSAAYVLAEKRIGAFVMAFKPDGAIADKFAANSHFAQHVATYPGLSGLLPRHRPEDLYNVVGRLRDEALRGVEIRRIAHWYLRVLNVAFLPAFHTKHVTDYVGNAFRGSADNMSRGAFIPWLVAHYSAGAEDGDPKLTSLDVLKALTEQDDNPAQRSDVFCLESVPVATHREYQPLGEANPKYFAFNPADYDRLVPSRFYYRGNVGDKFRKLAATLTENVENPWPAEKSPIEILLEDRLSAQAAAGQKAVRKATFDDDVRGSITPTDTFIPPEHLEAWANERLQRYVGTQEDASSFYPSVDYGRLPAPTGNDRASDGTENDNWTISGEHDVQFVHTKAGVVLYVEQDYTLRPADVATGNPAQAIASRLAIDPNDPDEVQQLERRVRLDCSPSSCIVGTRVKVFRPVSPEMLTKQDNDYKNVVSDRTRLFLFLLNNNYSDFKPSGINTVSALENFYGRRWYQEKWPEGYPTWASLVQSDRAVSASEWPYAMDLQGDPEFTLGDLGVILGISLRDGDKAGVNNAADLFAEQQELLSVAYKAQATEREQRGVIDGGKRLVAQIRQDLRRGQYKAAYRADFLGWLARNESARNDIVSAYQRVFLSYQTPDYDYRNERPDAPSTAGISPVISDEIVRLSPVYKRLESTIPFAAKAVLKAHIAGPLGKITPYAYQSSGARRLVRERGGLLAFDVGVGKTLTALLALGKARQEGKAQRPVICVPDSLVGKWEQDVREHFPTFRSVSIGTKMELGRKVPSRGRYAQAKRELAPLLTDAIEVRAADLLSDAKNAQAQLLLSLLDTQVDENGEEYLSRIVSFAADRVEGKKTGGFGSGAQAAITITSAFAHEGYEDLTNTDPMSGGALSVRISRTNITDRVEVLLRSGYALSDTLGPQALVAEIQAQAMDLATAEAEAIIVRGTKFWSDAGITLEGTRADGVAVPLDYAPMGFIQVKQKPEEQAVAWEYFRDGRYDVALCGHSAFTSGSPLRLDPNFVQEHTARTRPLLTQVENDAGQASPIKSALGRLKNERNTMRFRKSITVDAAGAQPSPWYRGATIRVRSVAVVRYGRTTTRPAWSAQDSGGVALPGWSANTGGERALFKLPTATNPTSGLILYASNSDKLPDLYGDGDRGNTLRFPGVKWIDVKAFQKQGVRVWKALVMRGIGRTAIRSSAVVYADITDPNNPNVINSRTAMGDPISACPLDPGFNLGIQFNGAGPFIPLWKVWGGPELRWTPDPLDPQEGATEPFDALGPASNGPYAQVDFATETTKGLGQGAAVAWWLSDEATGEALLLASISRGSIVQGSEVMQRRLFRFPANAFGDPNHGYVGPYAGVKFTSSKALVPWRLAARNLALEDQFNSQNVLGYVSTAKNPSIEEVFRGYKGVLPTLTGAAAPAAQDIPEDRELFTMGPLPLSNGKTLEEYLLTSEKRMLDPNADFRKEAVLSWAQAFTSGKRNEVDAEAKAVYFNTIRFPQSYAVAGTDVLDPALMAQAAAYGIPVPHAPEPYRKAHYEAIRSSYKLGAFPYPGTITLDDGPVPVAATWMRHAFHTGLVLYDVEARYPDGIVVAKSEGALIPTLYRCDVDLLDAATATLDAMRDALAVAVGTHKWNTDPITARKTGGITRKQGQKAKIYARATVGLDAKTGKDVLIPVYEGSGARENTGEFRSVIVAELIPGTNEALIYAPWAAAIWSWVRQPFGAGQVPWFQKKSVPQEVWEGIREALNPKHAPWHIEDTHDALPEGVGYLAVPHRVVRSPSQMSGVSKSARDAHLTSFGTGKRNPLRHVASLGDTSPAELFSRKISAVPNPLVTNRKTKRPLYFNEIKVDTLIVDEAHNFKALFAPGKRGSLGGGEVESLTLGATSKGAVEMEFRAAAVRGQRNGSVYLLTATPASTSPVEFYNILHYLGDGASTAFDQVGIQDQEQFISRYIEVGEDYVAKPGIDPQLRLAAKRFRAATLTEFQTVFGRYGNRKTANDSPFLAGVRLVSSLGHDADAQWDNTEAEGIPYGVFFPSTGDSFPVDEWNELIETQPQGLRLRLDGRVGGDYTIASYGFNEEDAPFVLLRQIFPKASVEQLPPGVTQVEANGYSKAQGSTFTWGIFKGARVPGAVINEVLLGMSPMQETRYGAYSLLLGNRNESGTGSLLHRLENASSHLALDLYSLKSAAVALETAESDDDAASAAKKKSEADKALFGTFFSLAMRRGPLYANGPTWEDITPVTKESGDFFSAVAEKDVVPRTDGLAVRFATEATLDNQGRQTTQETMLIPAPDAPAIAEMTAGEIYSALYTNPMFAAYGTRALMEACLSFRVAGLKPEPKGKASEYVVNFRGHLEAKNFHDALAGLQRHALEDESTSFLALSQAYVAFQGNLLGGLGRNVPYVDASSGDLIHNGLDYEFVPAVPLRQEWVTPGSTDHLRYRDEFGRMDVDPTDLADFSDYWAFDAARDNNYVRRAINFLRIEALARVLENGGDVSLGSTALRFVNETTKFSAVGGDAPANDGQVSFKGLPEGPSLVRAARQRMRQLVNERSKRRGKGQAGAFIQGLGG